MIRHRGKSLTSAIFGSEVSNLSRSFNFLNEFELLRSLLRLRKEEPNQSHAHKQPNTNWMQDKSSHMLSQHSSHEWSCSASWTANRADQWKRRYLHFLGDESLENVYSTRVDRSQEEARECNRNRVTGNWWHKPNQKLNYQSLITFGEFFKRRNAVGMLTPTVTINTKSRSPMWWAIKESVKRPAGMSIGYLRGLIGNSPSVMPAQNPDVT